MMHTVCTETYRPPDILGIRLGDLSAIDTAGP